MEVMSNLTETPIDEIAVDGCGVPGHRIPLKRQLRKCLEEQIVLALIRIGEGRMFGKAWA